MAVSSTKQKIVTKSSAESELVGLSDSVGDGVGVAELMRTLGFEMKPTSVFTRTICLLLEWRKMVPVRRGELDIST